MKEYYEIEVAGLKRQLPLCPLTDKLYIAGFVILGDVELTEKSAEALLKIAPKDYDYMMTAECKGIPLVHEMARQSGQNKYIIARKGAKLYMRDIVKCDVKSITTEKMQTLYLDGAEAELIKGKKILIVDDVISTGESTRALEALIDQAGGEVVDRITILAEGNAAKRKDIKYLQYLPVFDENGEPLQ